jgi:PAS domain S-box-containing protein
MTRAQRLCVGSAAIGLAAVAALVAATGDHDSQHVVAAVLYPLIGLAFVASGLIAWTLRPGNNTGRLLAAVGFLWMVAALWESGNVALFTIGEAFGGLFFAALLHLLLAYPRGRVDTRVQRALIISFYVTAALAGVLPSLFRPESHSGCNGCPSNALLIVESNRAADVVEAAFSVLGIVLFLGVVAVLVRRWKRSTPAARRILAPVYVSGGVTLAVIGVLFGVDFASDTASNVLAVIAFTAFGLFPFFFLAGLLRTKLMLGVRRLLAAADEPTSARAQDALRSALGDPTLRLAYWLEESRRYVDVEGNPYPVRPDDAGRVTTPIDSAGRPLAVIEHDAAITRLEPELLEQVVTATRIALEKDVGRQALRASEARTRAVLDALPDLMIRFRSDGTYLDIKGDTSGLVRRAEEMIGRSVWDLLPHEVVAPLMDCAGRALAEGTMHTIEYQLEIDGALRDFEARMVPSGVDEVVSIVRDVTQARRMEAELHARVVELEREQEFTRTVVETAPIIFLLVDTHGRVVRFNRTCARLLGLADDEDVRGKHFWEEFISPDYLDTATRAIDLLSAGAPSVEHECGWLTRQGELKRIAVSAVPIHDGAGVPHYLVCGLDVTDHRRQEEELRRSRARLVEAGDAERRRLERNLHDGAQQRLVSLSLALRLAQSRLATDAEGTRDILKQASDELALALEELRELARGIHPAVLTDRGLQAALEGLAGRSPVPVEVHSVPDERLPPSVEAAAFYVVSESLANVAKYAEASLARVSVKRRNGEAVVEVADDGIGGADPARGSGLRGLADRVEALDGRLEVSSGSGRGTIIRAVIPCG